MVKREHWTFSDYIEELIYFDEVSEIPEYDKIKVELIKEIWNNFPEEAKEIGLIVPKDMV